MASFLFFAVLLLLGVYNASGEEVGFTARDVESEASLKALFARWCSEHGKVYAHASEQATRYEVFKENVRMIHAHNSQPQNAYWMGLNRFSDLSDEEFRQRFSSPVPAAMRRIPTYLRTKVASSGVPKTSSGAPAAVDWRKKNAVTPVKDVGNCKGGTWAFAAVGAVESLNKIVTGELLDLSAQQLIDCDTETNDGCQSGFPQFAFNYVNITGLSLSSDYPYVGKNETCKKKNGYKVHIDSYTNIYENDEDVEAVLAEQVAKQPVTAAIDGSKPEFRSYKGGLYEGPCDNFNLVNMSVLVVGYGSDEKSGKDYWILKNSWGTGWGEGGYMKLPRGTGVFNGKCGLHMFLWYPTKITPPPSPSPPPPSPRRRPPSPPPPSPPKPSPDCPVCGAAGKCCCSFPLCFPRGYICCPSKSRCPFFFPGVCGL